MDAGFLSVVEIGQHFMTKDTSDSHNSVQRLVVSTLCQETKNHRDQKVGSKETPKLGPYWKLQPVICTVNMELRSEWVFEQKQQSLLGQNFSWIK